MTIDEERCLRDGAGHADCLFCGRDDRLGLKLSFRETGEGGVCAGLTCREVWQGYAGQVHGGMIASLLDVAMTQCLFRRGIHAVTGDMRIRFLEPIPCRAEIGLSAAIVRARAPLYHLRAELSRKGSVLAWSEARFMVPSPKARSV